MSDPGIPPRPADTRRGALILWSALQVGVLFLLGLTALFKLLDFNHPIFPGAEPVVDFAAASIAAVPVLAGFFVYFRNVVFGPWPNGRVARQVSHQLLTAEASPDAASFAVKTVAVVDRNFRGASILAWALGEGGALLAVCVLLIRGIQAPEVAVVLLWVLSMAICAPTQRIVDRYRRRLLQHAGLNQAQAETLLAQAGG